MADVFMTFAAADRARVAPVAEALAQRGLAVMWDHDALSVTQREAHLSAAKVVTPVWSQTSTAPGFDFAEANAGKARGAVMALFLDPVPAPPGFAQFPGFPGDLGGIDAFVETFHRRDAAHFAEPMHVLPAGRPRKARPRRSSDGAGWLLPVALGMAVLAAGAFFLTRNTGPASTAPLPDRLGVAEQYGLTPAEIAGLAPDALVRKALTRSTVEQFDAAATDDKLSLALLCAAQYYGEGTPRNEAAAAATCARGAEQNAPGAAYLQSLIQRPTDPAGAAMTLEIAAEAGDARAQHEVAIAHRAREPKSARATAELCAAQGHLGCRYLLAQMTANGEGARRDLAAATAAYETLATIDYYGPAMRELGKLARARGDAKEASLQFRRAAALDDGEASFLLGEMAERGEGDLPDREAALAHYRKADADGYAPAADAVERLTLR
jgi:TPR repeat protein